MCNLEHVLVQEVEPLYGSLQLMIRKGSWQSHWLADFIQLQLSRSAVVESAGCCTEGAGLCMAQKLKDTKNCNSRPRGQGAVGHECACTRGPPPPVCDLERVLVQEVEPWFIAADDKKGQLAKPLAGRFHSVAAFPFGSGGVCWMLHRRCRAFQDTKPES